MVEGILFGGDGDNSCWQGLERGAQGKSCRGDGRVRNSMSFGEGRVRMK